MEIASSTVPGCRGGGGSLCRARRLEAAAATSIPVAAGATVPGDRGGGGNLCHARRLEAAGATPIPVATEVVNQPLVLGGHGGGSRNRQRTRRRRKAAGSTPIPVDADAGLGTPVIVCVSADCTEVTDGSHGALAGSQGHRKKDEEMPAENRICQGDKKKAEEIPSENITNLSNQEDARPSTERKRKSTKVHDISFEVFRVLVNPAKRQYAHRLGKSRNLSKVREDVDSLPYINFKKERNGNSYEFHIMAFLWHNNILRLKRIDADKSEVNGNGLIAFVEPVRGTMDSLCSPNLFMDNYGYLPTEIFRASVKGVVSGLCFLWVNGLYHGNLKWSSIYYNNKKSVKLANFEIQESLSKEKARINDRDCLVRMLQHVSNQAVLVNPRCSRELIDLLINMLNNIDLSQPIGLEASILDNSFFWTSAQRKSFLTNTIALKLNDDEFVSKLPRDLCKCPWTKLYNKEFIEVVKAMNDYRETKGWSAYEGYNIKQFVSCICGAYTHQNMMHAMDIDFIVTRNLPLLVEKLRRLL